MSSASRAVADVSRTGRLTSRINYGPCAATQNNSSLRMLVLGGFEACSREHTVERARQDPLGQTTVAVPQFDAVGQFLVLCPRTSQGIRSELFVAVHKLQTTFYRRLRRHMT